MRARLITFAVTGMVLLFAPPMVLAHEKWFTDSTTYPLQIERLWSLPVLLALLAGGAAIATLWVLRRIVGGDNLFPRIGFLRRFDPAAPVVIAIQTAIALIYMAVNLHLLAPNLNMSGALGYLLAAAQIGVAFSFISGALTRFGALTLVGLVLVCGVLYGVESMLEQSIYAGIALYMLIQGRGLTDPQASVRRASVQDRYSALAPSLLRIFAGISITTLAFTEKLLNPDLGVTFLRDYPNFNVAQLLGLTWFTDERFIFAAGIVEFTVGVALLSGILPRLVIMGMFVPFNLTIPFLPPSELLGHLPYFAVMYVLVFHLPSDRLDAERVPRMRVDEQQREQPAVASTG
jgi:uncharacterized membrane protein YphA (DoxX/SURF4 family)